MCCQHRQAGGEQGAGFPLNVGIGVCTVIWAGRGSWGVPQWGRCPPPRRPWCRPPQAVACHRAQPGRRFAGVYGKGRDLPQPRTCICVFPRPPGPAADPPFLWERAGCPGTPSRPRCRRSFQPSAGVQAGFRSNACLCCQRGPGRSVLAAGGTRGAIARGCRGAHRGRCTDVGVWPWELPPQPCPHPLPGSLWPQ